MKPDQVLIESTGVIGKRIKKVDTIVMIIGYAQCMHVFITCSRFYFN